MCSHELFAEADRLLDVAEHGDVPFSAKQELEEKHKDEDKTLDERLLQLHIEESSKEEHKTKSSHVNPCCNLLNLICQREQYNRLLLLLLTDGYVLKVKTRDGNETDLLKLGYEEDELLSYFDNQELPPMLLDLLETALFYNGCVIVEVQDLKTDLTSIRRKHILLRPTTQSIICDSNLITRTGRWTSEEKTSLEGQLLLMTQAPLCLDPSPVVSLVARKTLLAKQKLNTVPIRRALKKHSPLGLARKRKMEELASSSTSAMPLLDFIERNNPSKSKILQQHRAAGRPAAHSQQQQQMMMMIQPPPTSTDVSKRARTIQKRIDVNDMTPHVVEEYILETAERGVARIYHTRLTIYQRLANDEYLGELYVERDYRENENKGSTCRFVLGTQPHALRYINQFTEIFTEEGRKSVKITHRVPNQPPRVTYTPGMRERLNERERAKGNFMPKPQQVQQSQVQQNQPQQQQTVQFNNNHVSNSISSSATTPSSSSSTSILQNQLQQQQQRDNDEIKQKQQQQQKDMAISAIMQTLLKESAQFEVDKPLVGAAQLPTRPVPAASLAAESTKSANQKLISKQLSFHKILNAQGQQQSQGQQQPLKVTVSPLAAQLSRPVLSASLPSYSQAQPKSKLVVTTQSSGSSICGKTPLSHDAPGLQALLANTPSADSPAVSTSSILERLVSGQVTSAISSTATVLTASNSDSTNDITLAALLAKPAVTGTPNSVAHTAVYSNKTSPLLQQLQQPNRQPPRLVPSPRPPQFSPSQQQQQQLSKSVPTSTMITLPVQESTNGLSADTGSSSTNVISLQNLLQSGVVNSGCSNATTAVATSSSIPVQLSIPGLSSPVTLSVNLPDGTGTHSVSSSPNVFVSQQQPQQQQQQTQAQQQKIGLSTVNKISVTGNQTVLFQSPGSIIQLPQQPTSLSNIKPVVPSQIKTAAAGSGSLTGTAPLLQVRQGQPVFLQMPSNQSKNSPQPIQIVRTQSITRQSLPSSVVQTTPSQVVINSMNSLKSPQQAGLLSPSSSIPASPQQLHEPLVAIQLQQQQQSQEHQLQLVAQKPQNIPQIKVRQQRKQTLK